MSIVPIAERGDSCGECANCRRSSQLAHPDLHFSFPTVGPKASSSLFLEQWRQMIRQSPYFSVNDWLQFIGAENKQGNITKEECVQIVKKLSLKASANDYKILLMWMPEYLGKEGNRLLKLIEEPPENTLFILVAERQELILNTILSRCQLVQTPGLTDEMVRTGLQHLLKVDKEQAEQFARLASGNLTEGLKLAQQSEGNHARLFLQWMRICYRGQAAELVEWANGLSKKTGREEQKHFLRYALHFSRELIASSKGQQLPRLGEKEAETAKNMEKVFSPAKVSEMAGLFNEHIYFIERNANPKILFLDLSLQMHRLMRSA
jgi:DNA polymerase-3 subunit delta'